MKIRVGFVSNSSSSSFVIAFKEAEKCPHCKKGGSSFLDLVRCSPGGGDDNKVQAIGLKAVLGMMSYQDAEEEEIAKVENTKLENGEELAFVEISYHDWDLRDELQNGTNVRVIAALE
jgi:hypothetical protein